ncbi:hypothetical protein TYRP_003676 [Tyrophagus putrescentiae]|nr:hypothetical protein TYRP_003676 [Tyrophagus putrescentiae]
MAFNTQDSPAFLQLTGNIDGQQSSEEMLRSIVASALTASIGGYSWLVPYRVGTVGRTPLTEELYIRWVQAVALMPKMAFHTPPWEVGPRAVEATRTAIALHQSFEEVFVELAKVRVAEGHPLIRPLWYEAPDDANTYAIDDQFMLGDRFLVAPVLYVAQRSRLVYLPEGNWTEVSEHVISSSGEFTLTGGRNFSLMNAHRHKEPTLLFHLQNATINTAASIEWMDSKKTTRQFTLLNDNGHLQLKIAHQYHALVSHFTVSWLAPAQQGSGSHQTRPFQWPQISAVLAEKFPFNYLHDRHATRSEYAYALEHLWVNTDGFALLADPDQPLFLRKSANLLCFSADQRPPYSTRNTGDRAYLTLKLHIFTSNNIRTVVNYVLLASEGRRTEEDNLEHFIEQAKEHQFLGSKEGSLLSGQLQLTPKWKVDDLRVNRQQQLPNLEEKLEPLIHASGLQLMAPIRPNPYRNSATTKDYFVRNSSKGKVDYVDFSNPRAAGCQHLPIFLQLTGNVDGRRTSEEMLGSLISSALTASIGGYSWILPFRVGSVASTPPSEDLYIRWLQAVTLMPRIAIHTPPWEVGPRAVEAAQKAIALHREFEPEFVRLAKIRVEEGHPIVRPLWYEAPEDVNTYSIGDQFMLGDRFLVAPVLEHGVTRRKVYLPKGTWVNGNYPDQAYSGEQRYNLEVAPDQLLYFRKREA